MLFSFFGGEYVPDGFYIVAGILMILFMILVYWLTNTD
ncbi:hypothetical protein KP77_07760 [Jeotgalibacillus alimentarius]|uniref:Uncharacterized protein n=1 Tax=Jeotgalibacillus alimentarius TaxID=135826 RepID=A0A0C2SBC3_9BACL|nr:hypothetical protein KP77_07760 [Jeotgalibacillus alimentarius]